MRHRRQRGGNTAENPERDARGRSGVRSRSGGGLRQKETGREKGRLRPKETRS